MSTWRAHKIFDDATYTLFAIASVVVRHSKANAIYHVYGKIAPVAVIVCSPAGTYALDMHARPVSIERLRQDLAGLKWPADV